jgi:hypothetical protein
MGISQQTYSVKWFRKYIQEGKAKGNKFGAKSTFYGGSHYHSKFEASYAMYLDWLIKEGSDGSYKIVDWDRQFKLKLHINGNFLCNYYIDFVEIHKDGTRMFTEVKGAETALWKMKWTIMCAIWPDIEGVNELDEYQIVK